MAEISMLPITPAQVRAIHVALGSCGIDDDAYRAILHARFDVDTCKALTRRQASVLLAALGQTLSQPPGARAPRSRRPASRAAAGPNVRRMVSPAQRGLIDRLAGEIHWRTSAGYLGWLKHNMGLQRVSTASQAYRVIEGLKAIRRRQGDR